VNVLHVDTGREWRGGQGQVLLLAQGLASRGIRVRLLAPEAPLAERARAAGLEVERWNARGEWDLAAMFAAHAAIRRFAADLVHCHSAHAHTLGVPAARLAGARTVVSRRVDFAVARAPWSALKYRMPVDRYFCISRGVMDVMRRAGIPEARLALVPSGVRLPDAAEQADAARESHSLRAAIGQPADTPVIGTVAALAPHKNHADLLRAARVVVDRRPDVHFAWIGEGELRAPLERQRRELGLDGHVHLLGFRADAKALLAQFTLFALASWLEGLCTSLLDAQALGVPIVATAVGGVPDVVADGRTGRLVPARDPRALADALLAALAGPREARAWAEAARISVRAFSADAMVENSLREYRAILGPGPA